MGNIFYAVPIAGLILALAASPDAAGVGRDVPVCLDGATTAADAYRVEAVSIKSQGIVLVGRLFLPHDPGPHPAAVLLHGGGLRRLNEAPLFFAPLLARCGVAALVYDKRGTGASGGAWGEARYDDFVDDAAAAVAALAGREDIDARRVGLIGFSQGGRLAPVVAARYGQVAFVVSVSGPFTSMAETRLYALEQRLRRWGLSGVALDSTLILWRKHFDAVARGDTAVLTALDGEVTGVAHRLGTSVLPPSFDRLPRTPLYNSIGRDYTAELAQFRVPMLAVYGDRDAVVPVQASIAILQRVLGQGGHPDFSVEIVPFADHSFVDWTFKQRIKIEEIVIDWILDRVAAPATSGPETGASQKR